MYRRFLTTPLGELRAGAWFVPWKGTPTIVYSRSGREPSRVLPLQFFGPGFCGFAHGRVDSFEGIPAAFVGVGDIVAAIPVR